MALTGKQRRALRAMGHHLTVVVQVGQQGVTEGVIGAAEQALVDHELIKVKVAADGPQDRHEAAEALSQATHSEIAQVLGHTVLLFRQRPEKSRFDHVMKGKSAPGAKAGSKAPSAAKPAKKAAKKPARKAPPRRNTSLDEE